MTDALIDLSLATAESAATYTPSVADAPGLAVGRTTDPKRGLVEVWSLDFMSDALYQGRRFRTLNVIDGGVREGLAIVVVMSSLFRTAIDSSA